MTKTFAKEILMQRLIIISACFIMVCITFGCTRSFNYIPSDDIKSASEYYFNQGKYSLHRKNAVDAMPNFSEAIRINPKYADAYYERARIYESAELTEQSNSNFETAKKLSKKYRLMDALEPLPFKLSKSDVEIIKPVPVPTDAAIVADRPKPIEK